MGETQSVAVQEPSPSTAVLQKFRDKKLALTPDALSFILLQENPAALAEKITTNPAGMFITKAHVEEALADIGTMNKTREIVVKPSLEYRPTAADVESQLKFHEEDEVTGKSTCTGKVDDFVTYFRDRYRRASRLLKNRASENGYLPLTKLKGSTDRKKTRIIGMVRDKRQTKNGFVIVEIEDEETTQACLLPKDAPAALVAAVDDIVLDEVLAFDGVMSGTLFIIKEVIWPDVPFRPLKTSADDVSIAFISDMQVGSKLFLQKQFTTFLEFLNGKADAPEHQAAAGKIKYLFVAGDVVDGIGIYPSQEKELVTKDVYTQFEIFNEFIKNVPAHIEVVIGPGNHDPVRIAQPRPRIAPEFTKELESMGNVHFIGDPGWFDCHGFKVLMFHGDGFFSMTKTMNRLGNAHLHPEKVAIEFLKRRHISPPYGDNPIVPENRDYLFMNDVPDIVQFGHIHRNGYANYRGTMIVNAGTWQDVTDYTIKQGQVPTPCQLPIYNLKTANLSVIDFRNAAP